MDRNGMALECMTGMDAKNCQIWQVLHIHTKNSDKMGKKLGMVLIIGDDVGALTTWSVRILNIVINANIARKSGKIRQTE